MNTIKTSLLALSMIAAIPADSYAFELPSLKNIAKVLFITFHGAGYAYYKLHSPVAYDTKVPFEQVFKGNYDNLLDNVFDEENIDSWYRIWPGQKPKSEATELLTEGGEKVLLIMGEYTKPISGEGFYYWCEKNLKGAAQWAALMAVLYALLYEDLDLASRKALQVLLDGFGYAKGFAENDHPQQTKNCINN